MTFAPNSLADCTSVKPKEADKNIVPTTHSSLEVLSCLCPTRSPMSAPASFLLTQHTSLLHCISFVFTYIVVYRRITSSAGSYYIVFLLKSLSKSGKLIFHIFGSLSEFERSIIKERTKAGLEAARKQGRVGGRKPKLKPEDIFKQPNK